MVRRLGFVAVFLLAAAGATVIASNYVGRSAAPPAASVTPPIPQVVAEEARWTTVPTRVTSTAGYQRVAAVTAPRDLNVGLQSERIASRIPTPPSRPPSTEWLLQSDRTHLAEWCRSAREARQVCQHVRRPRERAEARSRRSRVVVRIQREERRFATSRPASAVRAASAEFERSPNYDLLR